MQEEEGNLSDTFNWALGLVTRRRWWIILPACCVAILSTLALPHLPRHYSSEATLVVVQPQVSPLYVTPVTTLDASDVVRNLTREVLSRSRLLRIIDELGLYSGAPRTDALADAMRESIVVAPLDARRLDYSAFKLSFSAYTPQLAQAVTSRLASLFIEENLRTQGERAETTASFLNARVAEAKQKLDEQETRLKNFKLNNLGQLPQEQNVNLAAVTALRAQLQTTLDNLTRARRLRESLESVLTDNLARVAAERAELLKSFTTQHRTLVAKDEEIARTQDLLARLRGTAAASRSAVPAAPDDITFAQLRTQVETNAAEIASLTGDGKRLQTEIADYQKRLQLTPVADAQLATILRDRDQYTKEYADLLGKQNQSQLTASLEERQQGQHFRLVDPASLPLAPSSPDARKILLGGLAAGLAFGLGLAFLTEMRDHSFHTEKELAQTCSLPFVVGVPLMMTPRDERTRRWKRAFEWLAACSMLAAVVAAELHAYFGGPSSLDR